MPLTGPIPEGRTFFCPHCGSLYSVTYSRLSKSDSNIAKCVVCLQITLALDVLHDCAPTTRVRRRTSRRIPK